MNDILLDIGLAAGIVGSAVHIVPKVLTPLVSKPLFHIRWLTVQRIVGVTSGVILATVLWQAIA